MQQLLRLIIWFVFVELRGRGFRLTAAILREAAARLLLVGNDRASYCRHLSADCVMQRLCLSFLNLEERVLDGTSSANCGFENNV